jgi:hypothetical protein
MYSNKVLWSADCEWVKGLYKRRKVGEIDSSLSHSYFTINYMITLDHHPLLVGFSGLFIETVGDPSWSVDVSTTPADAEDRGNDACRRWWINFRRGQSQSEIAKYIIIIYETWLSKATFRKVRCVTFDRKYFHVANTQRTQLLITIMDYDVSI